MKSSRIIIFFYLGLVTNAQYVFSQTTNGTAHIEITANLGTFFALSSPDNSEFVQPFSTQIEISKAFKMSKSGQQWLQAGLGVQTLSMVTDHYFNKKQDNIVFEPLSSAFNYNRYQQTQLYLPIMFKQVLFSKNAEGVSLNAGIIPSYIVASKNHLRANGSTTIEKQMPDQLFQMSSRLEFGSINLQNTKHCFIWGAGMQYQFSSFLNDQVSFRPLSLYFKIGVGF